MSSFRRIREYFSSLIMISTLAVLAMSCTQVDDSDKSVSTGDGIIGGKVATEEDEISRSTVALVLTNSDILKEQCTGVIVSKNLIVTAAHCLENLRSTNVWVHFGAKLPKPFYLKDLSAVADFVPHPQYGMVHPPDFAKTEINDIAVLRLKNDIPEGFKPVPLNVGLPVSVGDRLLAAGYGHTSDRNTVRAKALNYAYIPVSRIWSSLLIMDQTSNQGVCLGDSGGPIYRETEKGLVVMAITRGAHNGSENCHSYTQLTNMKYFKNFIQQAADDLEGDAPIFVE